jgi:predicted extracellular nuclease
MLVSLDPAVVIGPTYAACGLAVTNPGSPTRIIRHTTADPAGQILNILHSSDVDCGDFPAVQTGDSLVGLAGPLHYHFEQFKIVHQETGALAVQSSGLPSLPPPLVATEEQISLASLNLHDYFDTVDDTGDEAEPKPTAAELTVKQAKLIHGISLVIGCPTILGLQEVEKAALLQTLAEGLVQPCGFTYQVSHLESVDGRGIDVALMSDARRVTVLHTALHQLCTPLETDVFDPAVNCPAGQWPLFSRPPLAVEVMVEGRPLKLLVVHMKSKREGEAETAPRRLAQAAHIRSLVEGWLAEDESAAIVVLGDFNDFDRSPPLQMMTAGGRLTNILTDGPAALPPDVQYTYIFGGAAQLIDGILVSPALVDRVTAAMILHSNADFPYTLAADTSSARLAYAFSDHDVPLILVSLEAEQPSPTQEPTAGPIIRASDVPRPTTIPPTPYPISDGNNKPFSIYPAAVLLGLGACLGIFLAMRGRANRQAEKSGF